MTDSSKANEFLVACAGGIIFHPFTHAKILIQLGHEPDPPVLKDNLLSWIGMGKKKYYYPNVFTYCRRIREEVGVLALFTTGLPAKITASIIQTSVTDRVKKAIYDYTGTEDEESHQDRMEVLTRTGYLIVANTVGTIVSHPFHVIMVRQIAQFVGKETEYDSIYSSIREIMGTEGIRGFFSGLTVRIMGEILLISFGELVTYIMNKYILGDRVAPDIKTFSPTVSHTLVSNLVYKYTVVSNMMAVSNSRLEIAMKFSSSRACYKYLKSQGALNRGGSLLFRAVPIGNLR